MTTQIHITGQIGGNHTLGNAMGSDGLLERKKGMFYSIIMTYRSKKDAKKSLSVAYQRLIQDEPDQKGRIGGINYVRGSSLGYDASRAVIADNV